MAYEKIDYPETSCVVCGKPFKPKNKASRGFCSQACYWADYKRRGKYKLTCSVCGKQYRSVRKDSNCCSVACSSKVAAEAQREKATGVSTGSMYIHPKKWSLVRFSVCVYCGLAFRQSGRTVHCQRDGCVVKHKEEKDRRYQEGMIRYTENRRRRNAKQYQHQTFSCDHCGKNFTTSYGNTRKRFCSDRCAHQHYHNISNKARRARLRGVRVEKVDHKTLFDRDNWTCQLCGAKTLRSKIGTPHDKAPEVDHIIPISQGGEHSYRNTQCVCRRCNYTKGNKTIGQLRIC